MPVPPRGNPSGAPARTSGMEPTSHPLRPLLALALGLALVAGCGGGAENGTQDPPATETSEETTTAVDGPTGETANDGAVPTGETPTGDEVEAAAEVVIVISDFAYTVPESVAPGAEVTVTNEDGVGHTVTSDEEGLFDVAVDPGATVAFTAPEDPGDYGFHCIPHPHMTSTLVVR